MSDILYLFAGYDYTLKLIYQKANTVSKKYRSTFVKETNTKTHTHIRTGKILAIYRVMVLFSDYL